MESETDSVSSRQLHIVMLPWLAMGHIIPFFHLAKRLALRRHSISFLSTPRNLLSLPKIPSHLSHNINLVSVSFSQDLPDHAESSTHLPFHKQHLLRVAADTLQTPVTSYIKATKPDWIIIDYTFHWLPAEVGDVPVAYFGLFTAATLSFLGPPEALMEYSTYRSKPEDFTVVPDWIPFESNVVYRLHEIIRYGRERSDTEDYEVVAPDMVRIGVTIKESDAVIVRSCTEFEPEWLGLLSQLYQKPVLPIGLLPPLEREEFEFGNGFTFTKIKNWLDKQRVNSVLYVALGTEASLNEQELKELALGLEKSELPFFWVLRNTPESTRTELEKLPDGFLERIEGRGFVFTEWAPQVEILSHDSVGGCLTHCGCNSVIESLAFGRVLIMLPVLNEQGLNARLLQGKRVGVEVPRKDDGSFTSDSVAESVRLAILDESGELLRRKAKEMKNLIGNKDVDERYVDGLVHFMKQHQHRKR